MGIHRSLVAAAVLLALSFSCHAFTTPPSSQSSKSDSTLCMSTATENEKKTKKKERYVPKWKKKATLAEESADLSTKDKGLVGGIPITFQQGEGESATYIETAAMPGQPLKLVASQAGQYIKYGCGKGECGTCESLCNGKYLRPCVDVVPTDLEPDVETGEYATLVIKVKGTRAKVISSGKFYSIRSIFIGFWNNLLGMGGLVRDRRKAKKNWQERMSKEEEIKRLTEEKKRRRAAEAAASKN